jgi:tetratricopeptide (TPR) repeat protein
MKVERPDIAALIDADSDRLEPLVAGMSWESRQVSLMALVSMTFGLERESRHTEALRFARIQYAIASSDPADRTDSFVGHTQPRNVGDALATLGQIQDVLGNFSEALTTLLKAEAYYQADAHLRAEAGLTKPSEFDRVFHLEDFRSINLAAIADVYRGLGDEAAYADYTRRAWQFSTRGADPTSRYNALIARAAGARERGNLDEALGAYFDASDLAPQLDTSRITGRDIAEAFTGTGNVYADLGLHRRALELYAAAKELNERSQHMGRLVLDNINVARVHAERGAVDRALESYVDALRCASVPSTGDDERRDGVLTWNDNGQVRRLVRLEDAWRIFLEMGRLERRRGGSAAFGFLTQAVDIVEQLRGRVVADQQRVGYQAKSVDVYDEIIETLSDSYHAAASQHTLEQLFEFIERAKARVLAELLADQPIPPPAGAPRELIEREQSLLEELQQLQQEVETAREPTDVLDRMTSANRSLTETWAAIAMADPDAGPQYVALRRADPSSCAVVRHTLTASGTARVAFVNFYVAPSQVISVTLFSDKSELHYSSHRIDRGEVSALVLVNAEDPPAPELRLSYWELDFPGMTIAPISQAVENYDVVCLSPHDVLHSVPLHALRLSDGKPPFIDSATVTYAPSAAVLGFCLRDRKRNVGRDLVLGNPARPDMAPIPQSEGEAIAVAELLGCNPLIGPAATRASATEFAGRAQHLHFACHCKFSRADPMESAMMLSDGNLTARDILAWRLNPDLVTVSACESGMSKVERGDELLGLVRALLFAGSPAVIVSLWNAYDASAAAMMKHFYELRMTKRWPKAAALADAQRTRLRSGTRTAQWASFVLIGDWR